MVMERWEKLEIWKLADELAFKVYMVTKQFPKDELYGITSQLRRAALSIPTNIVEGYSRSGDRELIYPAACCMIAAWKLFVIASVSEAIYRLMRLPRRPAQRGTPRSDPSFRELIPCSLLQGGSLIRSIRN